MTTHNLDTVRSQLCPTGILRTAINMTNGLLVTSEAPNGDPEGVSPSLAADIAKALNVTLKLLPYPGPGYVADALEQGEWDIGNIAAEPERAQSIWFSPAYCEIEATYLVFDDSDYKTSTDLDAPGVKIAAKARAAYELWLKDNLQHATLATADSFESSSNLFVNQHLDALSGLRPALLKEQKKHPDTRIIDDSFTAIKQCVGCKHGLPEASAWLTEFVTQSVQSGRIETLINAYGVTGQLTPVAVNIPQS